MGIETRLRKENYTLSEITLNSINRVLINIGMRLDQVDAIGQNPDFKGKSLKNVADGVKSADGVNLSQVQALIDVGLMTGSDFYRDFMFFGG